MKKYLVLLALPFLMIGCAKEPAETLPSLPIDFSETTSSSSGESKTETSISISSEESESNSESSSQREPTYQWVKVDKENCGLTSDDSTEPVQLSLQSHIDDFITYDLEIGAPCYLHSKFHEFVMKPGSYIKSITTEYHVDRLIVDFYGAKGTFFEVYDNASGTGDALDYHASSNKSEDEADGIVYEYAINGNDWCIKNNTEYNKPGIYSLIVVFIA